MKFKYSFLLALVVNLSLTAQKTEVVHNIKGTANILGDISPNQAKAQALIDAKINALKVAGVDEKISSYQLLFTSQVKNEYSQFFNSDIQSEMQGAIKSYSVLNERIYCKNEKEIVCEVSIDATVIKYNEKPDVTFDLNVEGIKALYTPNENLTFDLKTTQNSYLTIFDITDSSASLLYPNTFEKQNKLNKMESYKFPTVDIDYKLGLNSKKQETNRLIFVVTKSPMAYLKMDREQNTSSENIFSWIYSIPPDQRKVEYFTLTIQK